MEKLETILIGPNELDHSAVVPQCLDVHYVSDTVLRTMLDEGLDYTDPKIARLRSRDTFLEYRRALLFARQTVVNRANFTNELIYRDFEEREGNEPSRLAFRKLLDDGTIVPYLFTKRDFLSDVLALKSLPRAKRALRSLPHLLDRIRCVRLAVDDTANDHACERLDQSFRAFAAAVGQVRRSPLLLSNLAAEVYPGADPGAIDLRGFGQALQDISDFANHADTLNRTVLYERFLIADGSHDRGRFKGATENPHMLAQKKVIDLRYNTSLPDLLGRFALTPRGLPTHAAIDPILPSGHSLRPENEALLENLASRIAHRCYSNLQDDFALPVLDDLSIEDVYEIRQFDEWRMFAEAQETLLRDAPNCLEHLERVSQSLRGFQRALSRWCSEKRGERPIRVKQVGSVVSIALQVGGIGLAAFSDALSPIQRFAFGAVPKMIPNKVLEFTARLMIDFVDRTGVIDTASSFSLDIVRNRVDLSREDVRGLLDQYRVESSRPANAGLPSQL